MITFLKKLAAAVATPSTGKVTIFVEDSTGEPSFKDDTGTVTSMVGATGAAGQGVPTGGTAGQVLEKIDGTDFNTQWATPSGAAVSSVNGATGAVVLGGGDLAITDAGGYFTATDVEGALQELGAGGGGVTWTELVNQPFSTDMTGFTTNGTGSYAVSGGALNQTSTVANMAVCYKTGALEWANIMRIECEAQVVTGGGDTQLIGVFAGPLTPGATPTGALNAGPRMDSAVKKWIIEKFGSTVFHQKSSASWSLDTWIALRLDIIGTRYVLYADGALVVAGLINDTAVTAYTTFGVCTYGVQGKFRNFKAYSGSL